MEEISSEKPHESKVPIWRSRPVFITSTFLDMHAERDHLRNVVFPELAERLKERRHHLEPIDLRWGVETLGEYEEQAKQLLVLKVCLKEVERSQPFLIGLLGDRYGWIPPKDRMRKAAEEVGFEGDVTERSITDLEIDFGVLSSRNQRRLSFFYLREHLPYEQMHRETAALYSDVYSTDPEVSVGVEKLAALKKRIKKELPDRVRHYRAEWDNEAERVTGLEAWGQQVLEDLWAELKVETEKFTKDGEISWQSAERFTLEQFVEEHGRGFVGRKELLAELIALALSPIQEGDADWGCCVTGRAGAGKSAFFAALHLKLQEEDLLLLSHAAGISPRSGQVDTLLRRWIEELSEYLKIPDAIPKEATANDVEEIFCRLLSQTSSLHRVVVLIDALDQFETTTRAINLAWLPKLWPANARLIITAIPGPASTALAQRSGVSNQELAPLREAEACEIVTAICKQYRRRLNPKVLAALLAKTQENHTLACGNPLWLKIAVEELNLLDVDAFERAEKHFSGNPEEQFLQLLLTTVDEIPGDVKSLYSWMLTRADKLHGVAWTRAFTDSIAVSRTGWRESDLKILMPTISGECWEDLKFATLRRSFRSHIVQRGSQGQWNFAHLQMRAAIEASHLTESSNAFTLQKIIVDHLLSLPTEDSLHQSETMIHLIGGGDRNRAAHYYGSDLTWAEEVGATDALVGAADERWSDFLVALLHEDLQDEELELLAHRFVFCLFPALKNCTSIRTQFELVLELERFISSSKNIKTKEPVWQNLLSSCATARGDISDCWGDLEGARSSYQNALSILEHLVTTRVYSSNVDEMHIQTGIAQCYQRIGDILWKQKHLLGARSAYEKTLSITNGLISDCPDNQWLLRSQSVCFERLAALLEDDGDISSALSMINKSCAITLRLVDELKNIDSLTDLAVKHARMGDMYRQLGNEQEACWAYRESHRIRQALVSKAPDSFELQSHLAHSYQGVGWVYENIGDLASAQFAYETGIAILKRLTKLDPAPSINDLSLLGTLYSRLGDVLESQAALATAFSAYASAIAMDERILARDPTLFKRQLQLNISLAKLVAIAERMNQLNLEEYRNLLSVALVQSQTPIANATDSELENLWLLHTGMGLLLESQSETEGVRSAFFLAFQFASLLYTKDPSKFEWDEALIDSMRNLRRIGAEILEDGTTGKFKVRFPEHLSTPS